MSLAQGAQAVQTAALVVILQELHKAWGRAGALAAAGWRGCPCPCHPPPLGQSQSSQGSQRHSLWYMEKDRNWFRNFWYMSPSGLKGHRGEGGCGTWDTGSAYPAPTSLGPATHQVSMTPDRNVDT